MKRIKVAFFAEILIEDFDGASRTMFQLIKRINPEDFEFLFICGVGPDQLYGFECMRIPTITLPVNHTYKMALPVFAQSRIKEKLLSFYPDVVHIATPSLLGHFAMKYARRRLIPIISIYHTHFISYIDYYLKHASFLIGAIKPMIAESQRKFYNQSNLTYVPSESISAELCDMGIEGSRLKIWKRGFDASIFSPTKKDLGIIRKITENTFPTILFASRLVWEKNLETLFGVYDELIKKKIDINLLIAGDGIAEDACRARMPKAFFVGKKNHEDLAVLYASSDIFLFPSISETFGNVVLEAMASGLPCVIADGGGSKDFIEDGVNGLKCDAENAMDYMSKIQLLLENEMLREQFSKAGLAYSKRCNWQQLVQTYFEDIQFLSAESLQVAV
ncbi:glycosyltransferase family 4 protein [Arcticibacter eurypsychrophilus]|uniref:glycosyltransferase family 4 protein n=1 Tax=Arcticibacter eurypsychrophilus TaxID=1434752 RepID=UPI00084DD8B8|nr:glycosyltransferase family 1 protein [Arcticibacter eurypsychrophilus]